MKVEILKSGVGGAPLRFADPDPALPQVTIKKGEVRDDLTVGMCAHLIELGYAEEVTGKDEADDSDSPMDASIVETVLDKIIDESKTGPEAKDALANYAKTYFSLEVDTSKTVKKMRADILMASAESEAKGK